MVWRKERSGELLKNTWGLFPALMGMLEEAALVPEFKRWATESIVKFINVVVINLRN